MEIQNFLTQLQSIFENTNPDEIRQDTLFRDLEEWDSFLGLSLMALVDEQYKVKLTGDELLKSNTFADVFSIIQAKMK
jgi:acyl carrier protein